jgi:hypothetical protein
MKLQVFARKRPEVKCSHNSIPGGTLLRDITGDINLDLPDQGSVFQLLHCKVLSASFPYPNLWKQLRGE